MPRLRKKLPSYCLHKASGQAVVTLDDRDHYLGKHDTPESIEKYKELLAEWVAKRDKPPGLLSLDDPLPEDLRLDELLLSYLEFAKGYYVKNGKPTGEFTNMKHAVKPLADMYSGYCVSHFGPRHLKFVREAMIKGGSLPKGRQRPCQPDSTDLQMGRRESARRTICATGLAGGFTPQERAK